MAKQRIEIPAYTDRWMMSDRFGELVKVTRRARGHGHDAMEEIAHVKLDKSGKTLRFILDDCRLI